LPAVEAPGPESSLEGRELRKSTRTSRKSPGNSLASSSPDSPKAKEAILAAALKVFARDGYDGASMPKIAKTARVAAPLIHYYFGSKENLWRETVALSLGDVRRDALAIGKATRALAPLDRLRAFLQTLTQHAARWPDNFVMIIAEARSESDRFAWVQEHYTGVIFQELLSILQDAKDKKLIKDVAIDQLAFLLVGGVLVYFTVNPEVSNNTDPKYLDRISGEYTELMFKLLLEGIATKKR
jgi:AcrR family transcriptional regulator